MRRTFSICVAITVAAGGMSALTATGAASAAPSPNPAPTAVVQAMQRDLGLTAAQARQRIADDAAASQAQSRLRTGLGADYAGSWMDGGALVVAVTVASKADTVRAAGAEPTVVTRSGAALDAVKSKLDGAAKSADRSVTGWHVDVKTNKVVVLVRPGAAAKADALIAAAGVDRSAVQVVTKDEAPRPLYDVVGGDAYYINAAARCSIGFSVVGGFVSAGHCGTAGSTTTGSNQVAQGTFQASSFPGDDMSWVAVNASWTPQPWVADYAGGAVVVAGSAETPIGGAICRSGSTTGWHCGTVQATNATVNYAQGTVFGLTRTDVCAEPGDSGGSWISGNQAQGVTSGGSGNCTSGGTTYFQPVNEILSRWGLTLVTG